MLYKFLIALDVEKLMGKVYDGFDFYIKSSGMERYLLEVLK